LLALEDEARRSRVVACLVGIGEPVLPALAELLAPAAAAREQHAALEILRGLGPRARSCAAAVADLLAHPDATRRRDAALVLMRLGEMPGEGAPRLLGLLADPDREVRLAAATALGVLGADRADALDGLAAAAQDEDEAVAFAAIEALGASRNAAAVPVLVRLLAHANEFMRLRAAQSLGRIGSTARMAHEDLARALAAERSPHVAETMRRALRSLGR
jgi:HEAT repeat protein